LHRERLRTSTGTKESTKTYWLQTIDSLLRSWPGREQTRLSAITEQDCRNWASGYLKSKRSTGHNWKTEPGKQSARAGSITRCRDVAATCGHL
jgi:hypothetical protein